MFKNFSKIFITSLFCVALYGLFSPSEVEAAKFVSGNYTLQREEILHEDLFVAGETVAINGIVDGDVYIAANNISITGTISDDLYIAGSTVSVSGNVYGDLISVGSALSVTGSVAESAYLIGGNINYTGSVIDDLVMVGAQTEAEGYVDEDLIAIGGDLQVSSTVTEDLVVLGSDLSISQADVSGKVYQEKGAVRTQDMEFMFNPNVSWTTILSTTIIGAISMYLVGAFLIYIMPVKTLNIVNKATSSGNDFIKSFATGFVILFIASAPILILLSLTVVGLPLAAVLLSILVFIALYAKLWVEIGVGNKILEMMKYKNCSFYTALLIGRCISVLIGLIPIVGQIYSALITLVGTGAFFRMKYDLMSPKKKTTKKTVTKKKK